VVSVTEAVEFHLPPALEAKLLDLLPDAIEQQEPHIQDQLRAALRDDNLPGMLRYRPTYDPERMPFVVVSIRYGDEEIPPWLRGRCSGSLRRGGRPARP
jgi:hypothetical protein